MMTTDEVKAKFEAEGISIAEWARARGYKLRTVYGVLSGRRKCHRGIGHQIAVDLGIKAAPEKPIYRPIVDAA